MNANTILEKVRDLAETKLLELQPMAGEEMTLPQTDAHRDGFVAGERAVAQEILSLLEELEPAKSDRLEPVEEEMILSLGRS